MAAHGDVVYVLNTRDGGSIQGASSIGSLPAPIPPWHGALGLEPNATPEFLTTPGQVAFTPEGGKLLVTARDNTGAIEVFDVNARRLVDAAAQLTALLLFVLGHGGRRHGHQPRA